MSVGSPSAEPVPRDFVDGAQAAGAEGCDSNTVFVISRKDSVRQSLSLLFSSISLDVHGFRSADAFLDTIHDGSSGCAVLETGSLELGPMELFDRLTLKAAAIPTVFLMSSADVPTAVHLMKRGAVDVFERSVNPQELLEAVQRALRIGHADRRAKQQSSSFELELRKLTARERDVFQLMVRGKSNKEIGEVLAISDRTAEAHRARVLRKMHARSFAELLRRALSVDTSRRAMAGGDGRR